MGVWILSGFPKGKQLIAELSALAGPGQRDVVKLTLIYALFQMVFPSRLESAHFLTQMA